LVNNTFPVRLPVVTFSQIERLSFQIAITGAIKPIPAVRATPSRRKYHAPPFLLILPDLLIFTHPPFYFHPGVKTIDMILG